MYAPEKRLPGAAAAWSVSTELPRRNIYCVPLALSLLGLAAAAATMVGLIHVRLGIDAPKDPALVWSLVQHAALGVLVTLLQCLLALIAGRVIQPRPDLPAEQALLVGFPASLVLLACGVAVTLTVPQGGLIIVAMIGVVMFRFRSDLIHLLRLRANLSAVTSMMLPAVVFGLWLGLLWHGPTESLAGWPAGDEVYYTTLVTTLASDPWSLRNLGNEGETYYPFNLLWPAIGAAFSRAVNIEPFAFICASGGTAFILLTAILLRAYVTSTGRQRTTGSVCALILGFFVAGRYPFWVVESPPMIHAVPLSIAVWYWADRLADGAPNAFRATASAVAGSLLSKVVSAATLVPLAMGPIIPQFPRLPARAKLTLLVTFMIVAVIASWLIVTFAPRLLAVGGLAPESYVWLVRWRSGLAVSWPYLLRDVGTVVLAVVSIRMVRWWIAVPVCVGLVSALLIPFTMRASYVSAVIVLALAAFGNCNDTPRMKRWLIAGLLLCLPAMLFTDPGGWLTGIVWLACMGTALRAAFKRWGAEAMAIGPTAERGLGRYTGLTWTLAITCFLVAVARGNIGMASNWVDGKYKLTPAVHAVWEAVAMLVPPSALVFTDQTGEDWGLLGGWNTYAFHGKRQLYISTWVQSGELQTDEGKRKEKLAWNARVLDGTIPPTVVPMRGHYDGFYAVVDTERVPMLTGWTTVRTLGPYTIMRWQGVDGVTRDRAQ